MSENGTVNDPIEGRRIKAYVWVTITNMVLE